MSRDPLCGAAVYKIETIKNDLEQNTYHQVGRCQQASLSSFNSETQQRLFT